MADLVEGKLVWRGDKQKRQRFIVVPSKSGTSQFPISPEQISMDLPDDVDEIEVAATRDPSGRPVLEVRAIGQEFKAPAQIQPQRQAPHQGFEIDELTKEFHNPYNFVPAPDREGLIGELGDREPSGHDCYSPRLFSGKLRVKLTVETPLLIPDPARVKSHPAEARPEDAHKSFPLRIGTDGKPHLLVTSVKGMLRSAYEAVTNSRLSVFTRHDDRLGFRMESTQGAMMVPARVEGPIGNEKIVLYLGKSDVYKDGRPFNANLDKNDKGEPVNGLLCAAWLPTYYDCKISRSAVKFDGNRLPGHKDEGWVWLEKFQHYSWNRRHDRYVKDFQFWQVRVLASDETKLGSAPDKTKPSDVPSQREGNSLRTSIGEDLIRRHGYVCITGQNMGELRNTGANIENKHDERFFFDEPDRSRQEVEPSQILRDKWAQLIKDYRETHDNGHGKLGDPPKAKKKGQEIELKWSRHIRDTSAAELKDGAVLAKEVLRDKSLCYARVEKKPSGFEVKELCPVIISRRVHEFPPSAVLPPNLHPAQDLKNLSPADRVFGWVNQKGKGAYRGQIRIGTIECKTDEAQAIRYLNADEDLEDRGLGLPLAILGQPKPQQGRFYVAEDKRGTAQPGERNNEAGGYDQESKGLRGRKFYPHHANLPSDYWSNPTNVSLETAKSDRGYFKEYRRRRKDGKEQRDNQNRSVQAWVAPGTIFEFDVHVANLSDVELGALLWLLTLNENGNNDANGDPRFFRLGGGKPLGFGSVNVTLEGCDLRDGSGWCEYYRELTVKAYDPDYKTGCNLKVLEGDNSGSSTIDQIVKVYKDNVVNAYGTASFEQVSFIAAFLRAATGFVKRKPDDKELPTHYPRARRHPRGEDPDSHPAPPHEEGLAYEWFVENAKEPRRWLTRYALPDLVADEGLPIFPHEVRQG